MPKRIYTIEVEESIAEEEISEITIFTSNGKSYSANILPNIYSGIDGSSYEINLSNYVRNLKELEELWDYSFYQKYIEYIHHFPNITIDLSYNHLTDEYLYKILVVFIDERMDIFRRKLVKINIENNRLTKPGFIELFQLINICPNFKELEASVNQLSQKDYFDLRESGEIPRSIKSTFFYSSY